MTDPTAPTPTESFSVRLAAADARVDTIYHLPSMCSHQPPDDIIDLFRDDPTGDVAEAIGIADYFQRALDDADGGLDDERVAEILSDVFYATTGGWVVLTCSVSAVKAPSCSNTD